MSHFEVRYLSENEISQWDAFVENSEYGSIFHKSDWIHSIQNTDVFTNIDVIGCFNKDGKLLAGAILAWKRVLHRFKVITPPYATGFSGIVIEDRNTEYVAKKESYRFELLEALLDFMEKNYDSISLIFPPGFNDIRFFDWRKYSLKVHYTYLGNLSDVNEDKFLPDIRRRIRKAEAMDYKIKQGKDEKHLHVVFELISSSFLRQNHPFRFTKDEFIMFCKSEKLIENISVYSIWLGESPVSAIIIIREDDKAYYWLAGGDHTYFDTGLNQLLLWKVMQIIRDDGVLLMDLVGANTPSISKYKAGYNFDLVSYFKIQKDINPAYHFLFNLKNIFK